MNNKEAIEKLTNLLNAYEYAQKTNTQVMVELNGMEAKALNLAIKALEDRPQAITNEDIKLAINEGFEIGYEMAKAKGGRE